MMLILVHTPAGINCHFLAVPLLPLRDAWQAFQNSKPVFCEAIAFKAERPMAFTMSRECV
jgi:hypothetical protein